MTTKQTIVDIIIGARSDSPVSIAAAVRFGDYAFDNDFRDVPETIMQEWYKEYLDDRHDEEVRRAESSL